MLCASLSVLPNTSYYTNTNPLTLTRSLTLPPPTTLLPPACRYYEMAMRIDTGLVDLLGPKVERLRVVERIVANAEAQGMSQEAALALIQDSFE